MNYSKKQMSPLIDKYRIDVEANKLFQRICDMFDGQPNYQQWAVKNIFSGNLHIDELQTICDWAKENQTMIKTLEKKNLVGYSSKEGFYQLFQEMKGIDMMNTIKNSISFFNTVQRDMLKDFFAMDSLTPFTASLDSVIQKWYDIFTKYERVPLDRKKKFIINSSAYRDIASLLSAIEDTLKESYLWEKEDFLAFVSNMTPKCDVVLNQGPIVILEVMNREDAHILCGNGRTTWCITRLEGTSWEDYAKKKPTYHQYFLFDFSKQERDELAHIGFTIDTEGGFVYAHSTTNISLMGDGFEYNNKTINISNALAMANVKLSQIMPSKPMKYFKWSFKDVVEFVNNDESINAAIAYANEKENKIVLRIITKKGFNNLIEHSYNSIVKIANSEEYYYYVVLDFNKNERDNSSLYVLKYQKDRYGSKTFFVAYDFYGLEYTESNILRNIGLSSSDFIDCENINPCVLLHKYIDEEDENGAIKLIKEQGDNFDVNYMFENGAIPAFSALNNHLYNVFDLIVKHPKFDSSIADGFGVTILGNLLFLYTSGELYKTEEKNKVRELINLILDNDNFNFNVVDITKDTALNIACGYSELCFAVEKLVNNPNVNVNIENTRNRTALANAIRIGNVEAIKILGKRPDLVVRDSDKRNAKKNCIDLTELIKPEKMFEKHVAIVSANSEVKKVKIPSMSVSI